jgi:hypothetical protein
MAPRRDTISAPPWSAPRTVLLLAIGAVALVGAIAWFRASESAGGDSGWHSYADYAGAHVGIIHAVLGLAAIGAARIRWPLGLVIGVAALPLGLLTLGHCVGSGIAGLAGDGRHQGSNLLAMTSIALIVLGSIAALVDLVRLVRSARRKPAIATP